MDSMMMPFRKGDWQQRFNAISRCSPPISVQQWRQKWFSHCECSNIFNVQVLNIVCPILHCVPIAQLALPHLTDGRHGWRKNNISMSVNGQLSHRVLQFQNVVNIVHQYCFCTRESEAGRWEMHPITRKLLVGYLPEILILELSFYMHIKLVMFSAF